MLPCPVRRLAFGTTGCNANMRGAVNGTVLAYDADAMSSAVANGADVNKKRHLNLNKRQSNETETAVKTQNAAMSSK